MKKFRPTLIFAILVTAMAAYVFWDFTEQKMKPDLAEGEVELTRFGSGEVRSFQVGTTRLEFSSEGCEILEPVKDHCDDPAVQSFLEKAGALKGKKILGEAELKGRESEFGLEGPAATAMNWKLDDGKEGFLKIGSANSFDGSFYVQMKDLYVVGREAGQLTNKTEAQLRNKKVWMIGEDVTGVKHPLFQLDRTEKGWTVQPEIPFGLDPAAVQEWISNVQKIRATEVLNQKPGGLKSELKIQFTVQEKERPGKIDLEFFKGDPNFSIVKISSGEFYYQVPQARLKTVFVQPKDFSDGSRPFHFDLEQVSHVEITRQGKTISFNKKDKSWDHPLLIEFFEKLGRLKARTFEPSARFKIPGQNQVLLRNSSGKEVLSFKWGEPYATVEAGINQGESLRPVQVASSPKWTFGVSPGVISGLESLDFQSGTEKQPTEGEHHDHNH